MVDSLPRIPVVPASGGASGMYLIRVAMMTSSILPVCREVLWVDTISAWSGRVLLVCRLRGYGTFGSVWSRRAERASFMISDGISGTSSVTRQLMAVSIFSVVISVKLVFLGPEAT